MHLILTLLAASSLHATNYSDAHSDFEVLSQPGSSRSNLTDPQRDIDTIIVDDDFIEKTVYLQKIDLTINGKTLYRISLLLEMLIVQMKDFFLRQPN